MLFRKFKLDWRYGVTELFIVVLGVLIALWADGWRQRREDRALEREYLERLADDLRLDTAAVANIMMLTESRAQYGQRVLSAFDTGSRSGSASDFVRALEYANYFSYPSYSRTAIEDLMSTGNLRLIQSTDVKEVLSRYYAEIDWTEQFRELNRPTQLALMQFTPKFITLDQRYALLQEGLSVSCGPTLSCRGGIPWASTELQVTEADADRALEQLRATPEARPLYANMARIQGGHYANLASIRQLATDALDVLRQYETSRR